LVESPRTRDPDRLALPTGTVIFLLAEAEGGPSLPRAVLDDYQKLLGSLLCDKPGVRVLLRERETLSVAFGRAREALAAAVEAQQEAGAYRWPGAGRQLCVRMAMQAGDGSPAQTSRESAAFRWSQ